MKQKTKSDQPNELKVTVLKTELVPWRIIKWLQPPELKDCSKDAFEKLIQSITSKGFADPFKIWQNGNELWILDGHHRQRALIEIEKRGMKIPDLLPANFIDCRNRKEALELVLLFTSQYAHVTDEGLYEYLNMEGLDFDSLKMEIDLPNISLAKFEAGYLTDEVIEDEPPEPPNKARTVKGDLYEFGKHRLLCGDSTNSDDVARLMNGKKAVLFATDPPYGVGYGDLIQSDLNRTKHWERIENDEIQGVGTQKFLESVFSSWLPFIENNAAWYLWHAQKVQGYFTAAAAAAAAGVICHRQIVWVKPSLILGRGHYHWRHELCFYGWRQGHEPQLPPNRGENTVWEIKRDNTATYQHPTQKPVECFSRPMRNSTSINGVCAEPFAGSGSQFIAAEQTNRICYGMEIEPRYCDVIVSRWCKFTGQTKIKLNGKSITWKAS